jgi:hypothetical protein
VAAARALAAPVQELEAERPARELPVEARAARLPQAELRGLRRALAPVRVARVPAPRVRAGPEPVPVDREQVGRALEPRVAEQQAEAAAAVPAPKRSRSRRGRASLRSVSKVGISWA